MRADPRGQVRARVRHVQQHPAPGRTRRDAAARPHPGGAPCGASRASTVVGPHYPGGPHAADRRRRHGDPVLGAGLREGRAGQPARGRRRRAAHHGADRAVGVAGRAAADAADRGAAAASPAASRRSGCSPRPACSRGCSRRARRPSGCSPPCPRSPSSSPPTPPAACSTPLEGAAQAALAPRVQRMAEDELYVALIDVDLVAFDEPDFTQLVERVTDGAPSRVRAAVRADVRPHGAGRVDVRRRRRGGHPAPGARADGAAGGRPAGLGPGQGREAGVRLVAAHVVARPTAGRGQRADLAAGERGRGAGVHHAGGAARASTAGSPTTC